jgi:hypothetical protein
MDKSMRAYRYISGFSILLYLISSPLTGVWHTRIEPDGNIVYLGFVESFVFLIISSCMLTIFMVLSFWLKSGTDHTFMRLGIIISNTAMIIVDLAVVYCGYQGLINKFNWGNADFILFMSALPSMVIFYIGVFIYIYGYNEMLGKNKHK